jgi:gamma-tubulin complex component 3
MAPDRDQRIASAVNGLITHLIPTDPNESPERTRQRQEDCFELVLSILNRFVSSSSTIHPMARHACLPETDSFSVFKSCFGLLHSL